MNGKQPLRKAYYRSHVSERSFAIIDADHSPPQRPLQTTVTPPEQSLGFTDPSDRSVFDALRTEHTPWIVTSYSAMKEKSKRDHTPTDFGKVVIDEVLPVAGATNDGLSSDDTLPGGKAHGPLSPRSDRGDRV